MLTHAEKVAKAKLIRQGVKGAVQGIRAVPLIMMRSGLDDLDAIEYMELYPEWRAGKKYRADDVFRYEGSLYRVNQAHTASEAYPPDSVASLYTKITVDEETGFEVWKQPTGAHDAYEKGYIVQDPSDGNLYRSAIDGNVWGPPSQTPQFWELYQ